MSELTSRSLQAHHVEAALIAGANAVTPAASLVNQLSVVDNLTPLVGISFFIKEEFTIIEEAALSWYATTYVYVTGAHSLEPDFEARAARYTS